jgi:ABC-type transport system substrate-binding protein
MSYSGARAAPKKGGQLRVGMAGGNTTDSLDPATYVDSGTYLVGNASKDSLAQLSSTNEVVPALAEAWESSKDAKRWVFRLRKGVTFHSGKTLTAQDVIASINHHRGENSKSSFVDVVKPIEKIEADGAQNIVFTLKEGNGRSGARSSNVCGRVPPQHPLTSTLLSKPHATAQKWRAATQGDGGQQHDCYASSK